MNKDIYNSYLSQAEVEYLAETEACDILAGAVTAVGLLIAGMTGLVGGCLYMGWL